MKKTRLLLLLLCAAVLCLTGCDEKKPSAEEQKAAASKGEELMKTWLGENMPGAELENCKAYIDYAPGPGKYQVYVRTHNWVEPWTKEHAPGRFQLAIDGKVMAAEFGTKSGGWAWQEGDFITVAPDKLEVELTLHDLSGFDLFVFGLHFTLEVILIPATYHSCKNLFFGRNGIILHPDNRFHADKAGELDALIFWHESASGFIGVSLHYVKRHIAPYLSIDV